MNDTNRTSVALLFHENIIDVSAYNNNNVDNANNDDNGDDNYEGVNFNDNSEINDSNVEK